MPVERYLKDFVESVSPSNNTVINKRSVLGRFFAWIDSAGLDWKTLGAKDLITYLNELDIRGSSKRIHRSNISAFYEWAVANGEVEINPAKAPYRARQSEPRAIRKSLDKTEVRAILNTLPNIDDRQRFITLYSLARPVRLGELCAMKVCDVDLKQNRIVIPKSKNRKARWHAIPERAAPILKRLMIGKKEDESILGIGERHAARLVEDVFRKAEIDPQGRASHAFRHTVIERLIHDNGMPPEVVAEIAGNSTATIYQKYLGAPPDHKLAQAMSLAENF